MDDHAAESLRLLEAREKNVLHLHMRVDQISLLELHVRLLNNEEVRSQGIHCSSQYFFEGKAFIRCSWFTLIQHCWLQGVRY